MIQFLLWCVREGSQGPRPEDVARALGARFAPLFDAPRPVTLQSFGRVHVAFFELPVRGWRPSFRQEDDDTAALAIAYPLNGHSVPGAAGAGADPPTACLPRLARALQADPAGVLRDLVPPALLFWADKRSGDAYLVNDGLGHAQLFEAERGGLFALSNRIFAFPALGIPLEPVPEEWAFKVSVSWFPLDRTGFRAIRFAEPSTLYHWGPAGLRKTRLPVLEDWVLQAPRADRDCLEMARQALIDYIRATWPLHGEASGGLTGGFDSRAIFATYRHLGLNLKPRVKGPANNHDVVISRELARIAGLDLAVKDRAELPPGDPEAVRRSIRAALLWQAGNLDHHKQIAFLPEGGRMPMGGVNVMGHDGFIGRGFFQHVLGIRGVPLADYEGRLAAWFRGLVPACLDDGRRAGVEDLIRATCRQPARFGVVDEKMLDFLYLFERTRRWSSGSQSSQTSLVLAPFLNPGYIRAVFSYRGEGLEDNVFHRHIIAAHAPDWAGVVYERELRREEKKRRAALAAAGGGDWRRSNNSGYFNRREFWRQVGAGLIAESMEAGRLWRTVYDPSRVPADGLALGDELTMLYELERLCAE